MISQLSKLGIIPPILGLLLLGMLSGCDTLRRVERVELIVPCIKASSIPPQPSYLFDTLPQPTTPREEAEAIRALYVDMNTAKTHADVLSYLITPCIGDK